MGVKRKQQLIDDLDALRKRVITLEALEKESKQTEVALRNSQEQLHQAQKMEALGTLVAGVAHEINNPINLIMFKVPLLQKCWQDFLPILQQHAGRDPDKQYGGFTYGFLQENFSQLLLDMHLVAKRVAKIVKDLKNFARQSSVADKKTIQVNTAVENALRLSQTSLRKLSGHLELDLGPDLPLMEGNLHSIEQVTSSLIIGGVHAIQHAHGVIRIAAGHQNKDKRIYIEIEGNGPGISPSTFANLVDPFLIDKKTGLAAAPEFLTVSRHFEGHDGKLATLADMQKQHIHRIMKIRGGNRTRAVKVLGIGLRTLQRKLKGCGELSTLPKSQGVRHYGM